METSKTIAIVEDDPDVAKIIEQVLGYFGFRTVWCRSAGDLLRLSLADADQFHQFGELAHRSRPLAQPSRRGLGGKAVEVEAIVRVGQPRPPLPARQRQGEIAPEPPPVERQPRRIARHEAGNPAQRNLLGGEGIGAPLIDRRCAACDPRRERQAVERRRGDHRHHRDEQQHREQRRAAVAFQMAGHAGGAPAATGGGSVGPVRNSIVSGARPVRVSRTSTARGRRSPGSLLQLSLQFPCPSR